ncbi:hypothetical protein Sjap_009964 [Stephania japonica]|uniref:Nodulin-like domain-containing protein n=1 Tax=Stephania japonica TaxID=461633 RepID=A0AAP0J847_9MAGN
MGALFFSQTSQAGKWLGFVTAIWVQAISGNNYTFSNYSDALKSLMALTQLQLNQLSVAKDVGKAFGILAGLASDKLPTPLILLIGSLEGFIGYGVQWLVVSQKVRPLPYWQMCIFLCMGGNSTTWMNTAVLVTCMRNFRKNRGPVSGILKGYVGLSTAIFTDLCSALFSDSPSSFLLMLAIVPAVVCLAAVVFLREVPETATSAHDVTESHYFNIFNTLAIVIALYLLAFDVTGNHGRTLSIAFSIGLLILLSTPLVIPLYSAMQNYYYTRSHAAADIEHQIQDPLLAQEGPIDGTGSNGTETTAAQITSNGGGAVVEPNKRRRPLIGEDHSIVEATRTLDFWVLFVSFLCGVGTGMAVMNNMGQMGLALGHSDVSLFVSLISISGFFGRIASGSVSEYFLGKAATPRPLWNAASQILMTVGYVVLAMALPGSLYIGSIVIGFCYGVRLAISVPTASELFGLKNYGLLYNVLILNLPLGSFLFSGLLAGFLYDAEATKLPGGGNTCIGAHCYRNVFIVMAFVCLLGFVLDLVLAYRTKSLYSKIRASKKSKRSSSTVEQKPINFKN